MIWCGRSGWVTVRRSWTSALAQGKHRAGVRAGRARHDDGVRFNRDRSQRFAFDRVPQHYDRGRRQFAQSVADLLIDRAQLVAGAHVLEVGAGTGQLTIPLAKRGAVVTALEPGERLAAVLQEHLDTADVADVSVVREPFKEYESPGRFDAVVAANSFQWIDPHVGYHHAADLLGDRGLLALLWNIPLLADAALQRRLNEEAFGGPLADLRRDPDRSLIEATAAFGDGRREMAESGRFGGPWWSMTEREEQWSLEQYSAILVSLASTVDHLDTIHRRLDEHDLPDPVAIVNHTLCLRPQQT